MFKISMVIKPLQGKGGRRNVENEPFLYTDDDAKLANLNEKTKQISIHEEKLR